MRVRVLLGGLLSSLLMISGSSLCHPQKGSGGQTASKSGGGNSSPNAAGDGSGTQAGTSSGSGQSGRIEATMLAYEASDKIATHIAERVKGHALYVYDGPTFAAMQEYDAYDATVGIFETSFSFFTLPGSSFVAIAPAVQQIASTVASLRSTAEYSAQAVDFQTDPIIAQIANHLTTKGTSVIVPKLLLLDDDLASPPAAQVSATGCAQNSKTVPAQLECLLKVRNAALQVVTAVDPTTKTVDPNKVAAFTQLDKLFQTFFGSLLGSSVNLSADGKNQQGTDGDNLPGKAGAGKAAGADSSSQDSPSGSQAGTLPLLSHVIQGRRLRVRLGKDARVLVLEATAAGGGSRIKHNLWVELFWVTPTPTFTGGAIVTYLLLNPENSSVEGSEVLRFDVDYGKFHGNKIQTPANF